MPLIQFQSLNGSHKDAPLSSPINFDVSKGDKVLIQGPSGIGKSSLFKALLGFSPLKNGRIFFDGKEVIPEHIRSIRHRIFYLSQYVDLPDLETASFLSSLFAEHDPSTSLQDLMAPFLDTLSLKPAIFSKKISTLSGGERQRVGLLIGFILKRPVWLLDEPTSALDSELKERVASQILSFSQTALIISHDKVWNRMQSRFPNLRIERIH